ncbi:MAG: hypothetical protein FWC69_05410 [Defluviitaleaceae bacterium]|nr:hypothetical protein [Defluviitaleaceae bacterium]
MNIDEPKYDLLKPDPLQMPERSEARLRYYKPKEEGFDYRGQSEAASTPKRQRGLREKLAIQGIICGVFLAVFMLFNLIDSPFTNDVSAWVESNLSFDMITEEGGVGAWTQNFLSFFDDRQPVEDYAEQVTTPITPANLINTTTPTTTNSIGESWVDENILNQITD